jgi:hypothetical protein
MEGFEKLDAMVSDKSPLIQVAYNTMKQAIFQLASGECNEGVVGGTLSSLSPQTNGYVREDEYVTVDEAMRILHMGQNRIGFYEKMKKHKIDNEMFNNVHIGFSRAKILALKAKEDEEWRKRRARQQRKLRRANRDKSY